VDLRIEMDCRTLGLSHDSPVFVGVAFRESGRRAPAAGRGAAAHGAQPRGGRGRLRGREPEQLHLGPEAGPDPSAGSVGRRHVEPMQKLWTVLVLVAAAINFAPVLGVVSPERMGLFYGVDLEDPNLQILMLHRAILFGIVGGLLFVTAFHLPLRALGYAVGFSSMVSFLLIAWGVGGYNTEIQRVMAVDVVGIAALAGAGVVHAVWLRGTPV